MFKPASNRSTQLSLCTRIEVTHVLTVFLFCLIELKFLSNEPEFLLVIINLY